MEEMKTMEKEYEENVTKKSEVFLFPELCVSDNYYENIVELKAKIGQEKTYALSGWVSGVMRRMYTSNPAISTSLIATRICEG